jgi:hypothetical protein
MDHGEDARARELDNLRLALATFALQLDSFELRASGALLAADKRFSEKGFAKKDFAKKDLGKNDWPSIKSPGSKSDT